MWQSGSGEPFISENIQALAATFGYSPRAMQWRKPLSIMEINRMASTPEVRERRGRP